MSKEILLITNYFPPEKGAAPNRMYSLAEGLGSAGFKVKVVCPLPNYPTGKIFKDYKAQTITSENVSFGKITRIWVWPSNSTNKFVRLLSMISFSFSLVLFFLDYKIKTGNYFTLSAIIIPEGKLNTNLSSQLTAINGRCWWKYKAHTNVCNARNV